VQIARLRQPVPVPVPMAGRITATKANVSQRGKGNLLGKARTYRRGVAPIRL